MPSGYFFCVLLMPDKDLFTWKAFELWTCCPFVFTLILWWDCSLVSLCGSIISFSFLNKLIESCISIYELTFCIPTRFFSCNFLSDYLSFLSFTLGLLKSLIIESFKNLVGCIIFEFSLPKPSRSVLYCIWESFLLCLAYVSFFMGDW